MYPAKHWRAKVGKQRKLRARCPVFAEFLRTLDTGDVYPVRGVGPARRGDPRRFREGECRISAAPCTARKRTRRATFRNPRACLFRRGNQIPARRPAWTAPRSRPIARLGRYLRSRYADTRGGSTEPAILHGDDSYRCVRELRHPCLGRSSGRNGKFRVSLPCGFTTNMHAQRCGRFAYFLLILRTNSRQRRTNQGKYEQLANRWQKGG
jgi:hypothetical protein